MYRDRFSSQGEIFDKSVHGISQSGQKISQYSESDIEYIAAIIDSKRNYGVPLYIQKSLSELCELPAINDHNSREAEANNFIANEEYLTQHPRKDLKAKNSQSSSKSNTAPPKVSALKYPILASTTSEIGTVSSSSASPYPLQFTERGAKPIPRENISTDTSHDINSTSLQTVPVHFLERERLSQESRQNKRHTQLIARLVSNTDLEGNPFPVSPGDDGVDNTVATPSDNYSSNVSGLPLPVLPSDATTSTSKLLHDIHFDPLSEEANTPWISFTTAVSTSVSSLVDHHSVVLDWDDILTCFEAQARRVYALHDRKAIFDTHFLDTETTINMLKHSIQSGRPGRSNVNKWRYIIAASQKKDSSVDGAKDRWFPLLALDAVHMHHDAFLTGVSKLQTEHGRWLHTTQSPDPKQRSFNQHLAMQCAIWNIYLGKLKEMQLIRQAKAEAFASFTTETIPPLLDQIPDPLPTFQDYFKLPVKLQIQSSWKDAGILRRDLATRYGALTHRRKPMDSIDDELIEQARLGNRWLRKLIGLTVEEFNVNLQESIDMLVRDTIADMHILYGDHVIPWRYPPFKATVDITTQANINAKKVFGVSYINPGQFLPIPGIPVPSLHGRPINLKMILLCIESVMYQKPFSSREQDLTCDMEPEYLIQNPSLQQDNHISKQIVHSAAIEKVSQSYMTSLHENKALSSMHLHDKHSFLTSQEQMEHASTAVNPISHFSKTNQNGISSGTGVPHTMSEMSSTFPPHLSPDKDWNNLNMPSPVSRFNLSSSNDTPLLSNMKNYLISKILTTSETNHAKTIEELKNELQHLVRTFMTEGIVLQEQANSLSKIALTSQSKVRWAEAELAIFKALGPPPTAGGPTKHQIDITEYPTKSLEELQGIFEEAKRISRMDTKAANTAHLKCLANVILLAKIDFILSPCPEMIQCIETSQRTTRVSSESLTSAAITKLAKHILTKRLQTILKERPGTTMQDLDEITRNDREMINLSNLPLMPSVVIPEILNAEQTSEAVEVLTQTAFQWASSANTMNEKQQQVQLLHTFQRKLIEIRSKQVTELAFQTNCINACFYNKRFQDHRKAHHVIYNPNRAGGLSVIQERLASMAATTINNQSGVGQTMPLESSNAAIRGTPSPDMPLVSNPTAALSQITPILNKPMIFEGSNVVKATDKSPGNEIRTAPATDKSTQPAIATKKRARQPTNNSTEKKKTEQKSKKIK